MATLGETVTRALDDLSRADADLPAVMRREVLSAIEHYGSRRFAFNETILTVTLSATSDYTYQTIIGAQSTTYADILDIDQISVVQSQRQIMVEELNYATLFMMDRTLVNASYPDYWSTFDRTVKFYPTPNQSLSAQLTAHVRLIALDDGDSNAWTTEAEELVRSRACKMVCLRKLDDYDKGQMFAQLEVDALARLREDAFVTRSSGILATHW